MNKQKAEKITLEQFEKRVVEIEKNKVKSIDNALRNAMYETRKLFESLTQDQQMEVRRRQQAVIDEEKRSIILPKTTMH